MASKPTVRIIAVDKSDKTKKVELFHGWDSAGKYGGYSLKLSRENTYQGTTRPGVAKIVLTDGRVITPDSSVFFNVQVYADSGGGGGASRVTDPADQGSCFDAPSPDVFGDDEPPF